jgi:hypothetical protein
VVHRALTTAGRFFNPTVLILAGICFAFPFVTVACNTPGGYGRAAQGGTTAYSGIDIAAGGRPQVTPPDSILPLGEQRDDQFPPQPAAIVVLILLVAGTGFAIAIADPRARRVTVTVVSGVAGTALLVNQALFQSDVALRVGEQAGPLPSGKTARDYVHVGPGFLLCLLLLLIAVVVNAVGWWRARPRPALVSTLEHSPPPP